MRNGSLGARSANAGSVTPNAAGRRVDRLTRTQRTWTAAILFAAFGLHGVAFLIISPGDAFVYVIPWYHHVIAHGIGEPVGNYSPPYLYLLWGMSFLHGLIWDVVVVKLLSLAGAAWLVFSACRLLRALDRPLMLGLLVLALPSVIMNTSALGQADAFWVAPCLLAVAASIEGKCARVAAWAGLAFAIKQQAAWLAPFVAYVLIIKRAKLTDWLAAPLAFSMAWLPAWIAGWPLAKLIMIYPDQATVIPRKGPYTENGASLWSLVAVISKQVNFAWRWLGLPLAAAASAFLIKKLPKTSNPEQLMIAAILSAGLIPFLLPMMHERFFMLADVLAFLLAIAFPTKRNIALAIIVQIASAWPVFVCAFRFQPAQMIAPPLIAVALWMYWLRLRGPAISPRPVS